MVVEQAGEPAVEKCNRLILVEGHLYRVAGSVAVGERHYLLYVDVFVAATAAP